jgi:3-oxoacyl-[acyl-carrier-protein] synthase I
MQFALAGGVDTLLDPYVINTLDRDGRIKSNTNLDGFIPGEGAAFVLLAARPAADNLAIKALAKVTPAVNTSEPGHLLSKEPYKGEGLTQAFKQLFAATPPPAPLAATWSGMNGESHWGKEWGIAAGRVSGQFAGGARIFHPADCYGDLGAAAGPALVALASHGIANGYRPAPALVYCSNDGAARSALIVSAP